MISNGVVAGPWLVADGGDLGAPQEKRPEKNDSIFAVFVSPVSQYTRTKSFPPLVLLKLSRQDSFGTPVGVRLSFLYPSPMRGPACHILARARARRGRMLLAAPVYTPCVVCSV